MGRNEHLGELEGLVMAAVVRTSPKANGAAVYQEIEERAGRDPGVAGVHVTLRRLQAKGLLSSGTGTASSRGGRPRRYYSPTQEGLKALREFSSMWTRVLDGLVIPDPESTP
jgi:DNA-binding PadR family transcriptional regulator